MSSSARRAVLSLGGVVFGCVASCSPDFSTQRVAIPEGTLGAEVFRIVCERVDVGENPTDLTFALARHACTVGIPQGAPDDTGVGPKVNALGHLRPRIVTALDTAMPLSTHVPLDHLLVNLLPLYGPDGSGHTTASGTPVITLPDGGTTPAEDLLPQATRGLTSLLNAWSTNADLLRAFSRQSNHLGFRPEPVAMGLLRPIFTYGPIDTVLDNTFRLFRDGDTGIPAGVANGHFNTLLATLQGEFAASSPAPDAHAGTVLDAAADLFFRTDPVLATGTSIDLVRRDFRGMPWVTQGPGGAFQAPFIDANHDGLADSAGGVFVNGSMVLATPTPFATTYGPSVPRDADGRALTVAGDAGGSATVYQYVNLDGSVLAGVSRQLSPLLGGPGYTTVPAMQLLHGASVLFGTRRPATRNYGTGGTVTYSQYSADTAPVVDLVHATGQLLSYRDIDPVLATTRALVASDREALTARLVGAMLGINDLSKMHPEATIAATSDIWDDVMAVVRDIAQEPGLLEDILDQWSQNGTQVNALGPAFSAYAQFRDLVQPDWSTAGYPLTVTSMSQPVDRTMPDVIANRSALGRLLWLVDDLSGAQLCSRPGAQVRVTGIPLVGGVTLATASSACDIFEVDDAAAFYVRSMDGRSKIDMHIPGLSGLLLTGVQQLFPGLGVSQLMDSLIQSQSGIQGFTSLPTPQAINRMVFRPPPDNCTPGSDDFLCNLVGPAQNRYGQPTVATDHPGTIFVWELYGFYNAIRPLAHAFVLHDVETCKSTDTAPPGSNLCADPNNITGFDPSHGTHLFVQLLSALHRHWATAAATDYQHTDPHMPRYTTGDGASVYEPVIAPALAGDIVPALSALTASLRTVDAGNDAAGNDLRGDQAIAHLARALVDPTTLPVTYRSGATSTVQCDGTTPIPQASLYNLFADAFNQMDSLFAADTTHAHDDWAAGRSATVDQFISVDGTGPAATWHNPTLAPVTRLLIEWLQMRVSAHHVAGDYIPWTANLGHRLEGSVQGPVFASALDMAMDVYNDAVMRGVTAGLLDHLLDPAPSQPGTGSPFATTVTSVGDLVQVLRDDTDVDPVLHGLSSAMAPRTGAGARGIHFFDRARSLDADHVLTRVLAAMVQRPATGDEPMTALADAIADTHRAQPGLDTPLSPTDFHDVFANVRDFFGDTTRGMEQFYYIVQHRRLP